MFERIIKLAGAFSAAGFLFGAAVGAIVDLMKTPNGGNYPNA